MKKTHAHRAKDVAFHNAYRRLRYCRHGPLLYLVTDKYVGRSLDLYGEYSEGEVDLFGRIVRQGDHVVEVGANFGTHTVPLARMAGPKGSVLAFEPQRVLFHILCANMALNGIENVDTRQAAVGREAGGIVVPRLDYARTGNFGGVELANRGSGDEVPLVALDDFDPPACRLIKIDVEGMEGEVIAGAEGLIRRLQPLLYVENDRPDKSAALIRRLFELDYRLYWHLPKLFNPNNFLGNAKNAFPGVVSTNMLCLPRAGGGHPTDMHEITSPDADWHEATRPVLDAGG